MASKKRVFLDANFFLIPFQFGVDIFSELEKIAPGMDIFTLIGVKLELEGLAKSDRNAKAALGLVEKTIIEHKEGPADEALFELSSSTNIVCTNDKVLKEKITRKGAPVIYLRQKSYLAVDGYI
jgi:rRNA-processing protein FCF1